MFQKLNLTLMSILDNNVTVRGTPEIRKIILVAWRFEGGRK